MAFDDLKDFNGKAYTGMPVGGHHTWLYTDAIWRERKVAPDAWEFAFRAIKRRDRSAPAGSGVPPNTLYHWYILAHQRVRKIDEDSYTTFMSGRKYKVAHKRPHWRRWSCEYPDRASEGENLINILEGTLALLRDEERTRAESRVTTVDAGATPSSGPRTRLPGLILG